MGTIFVAYGGPDNRERVLEFAADQAAASGDDLFVYHVQESADDRGDDVSEEVARVVGRTAPEVAYEIRIDAREGYSDQTNVSKQKPLVDTLLDSDRDFEYAVMGNRERSPLDELVIPSMTETVLETRAIPVVLVPV